MFLDDCRGRVDFINSENEPSTLLSIKNSPSAGSSTRSYPAKAERMSVHVVAELAQTRAAVARMIFAAGHHAEVYTDASEVVKHRPGSGIVLVEEAGQNGATSICKALSEAGLWLPVIGFGEQVEPGRIVAGMKAGAMDFFVGQLSVDVIVAKLKACAEEARVISEARYRMATAKSLIARLSEREREVLDYMVVGHSNKEMAREMGISPRTVEIHRMKMMGKLGASSSARALRIRMDAQGLGSC